MHDRMRKFMCFPFLKQLNSARRSKENISNKIKMDCAVTLSTFPVDVNYYTALKSKRFFKPKHYQQWCMMINTSIQQAWEVHTEKNYMRSTCMIIQVLCTV